MPNQHLTVYLNDHLAGAAAALELLGQLRKVAEFEEWADDLRARITVDRHSLESLMREADIKPSATRQAAAWLTSKLAELKTRIDDHSGGGLQQLELIEALALGIDGKRALWAALKAAAEGEPSLRALDYSRLIDRAEEQRRIVEVRRLQIAKEALTG